MNTEETIAKAKDVIKNAEKLVELMRRMEAEISTEKQNKMVEEFMQIPAKPVDIVADLLSIIEEARYDKNFMYKQVERGLFCKHTKAKNALKVIAYSDTAPWADDSSNWDVSHKDYADEFYKAFPPIPKEL